MGQIWSQIEKLIFLGIGNCSWAGFQWRFSSRDVDVYRMFCVWIHLGMLDVTLDGCGDNKYIVVEDEVWMEKKWSLRSVGQQFGIWNMLLGLQWLLAMAGGQMLMKGKVDNRIFETRGQILEEELENLYKNERSIEIQMII